MEKDEIEEKTKESEGICKVCTQKPIEIQIREMCRACYESHRRKGLLEKIDPLDLKAASKRRLKKKHGVALFEKLEALRDANKAIEEAKKKKKRAMSMADIGREHGLGRARVKQIYKEHIDQ